MSYPGKQMQLHFSCALAVLKSKPVSVSVEGMWNNCRCVVLTKAEYVSSLRKSLLYQEKLGSGLGLIIDGTALWHHLFLHIERRNLELRTELATPHYETDRSRNISCSPHKRKQAALTRSKIERHAKRRKLGDKADHTIDEQHIATFEQHRGTYYTTVLLAPILMLHRSRSPTQSHLRAGTNGGEVAVR